MQPSTRPKLLLSVALAATLAWPCTGELRAQDADGVPAPVQTPPVALPPGLPPASGAIGPAEEAAIELQRGNTSRAIELYTLALTDTGLANDRRATFLNDRAVARAKAGETKAALTDYNQAVQLFAEFPSLYNNRGNLLVAIAQYEEAIKDFDRAILLAPRYAAAHSNRANARMKLGQYAEAVADFTRAIELMPQSAPPLSGRGLAHLAVGKPHAAIRDFSRAVNADARFASAYRNRAEARMAVDQGVEAIEDLSRAAAFDTMNPEIYLVRGYAYLAAANALSAIKDFTRAIELAPAAHEAYEARGLANAMAQAYEEAFGDLNRAVEIDPRSALAFAYRAYVYKQTQQMDVAQKDVETALKLDADAPEVLWALGEMEEARGHPDAAIAAQRRALAARPGWKPAEEALKRLGASQDAAADVPVEGAGTQGWQVVVRNGAYFALSEQFPGLRVPLEMMGKGQPKLIQWEVKEPPFNGYAMLRFASGQVLGAGGPEETEQTAIVDTETAKVLAIQPSRQGDKVAKWTWEESRVQVASIDGVTDEFQLRASQPAVVPAAPAFASAPRRTQAAPRSTAWAPWDQPFGVQATGQPREPKRKPKRAPKPKSIFDLLFN